MKSKVGLIMLALFLSLFGFISVNWKDEASAQGTSTSPSVIKVGVACALKKSFGIATVNGAKMAADEINGAGGVLGAKIELITADSEATAPGATAAIEKLYYDNKVNVILGAYTSEEATAFQSESAKLGLICIFHGSSHILDKNYKAAPEKYKYYWNYNCSDIDITQYIVGPQLELMVNALTKKLGLDKINVAVVTDASLWTETLHTACEEAVKGKPNCKLVYTAKIAREARDFTAEITEMKKNQVQLILLACGQTGGYTFVKQMYDVELPALVTGLNVLTFSISDFIKAVGVGAAAYQTSLGYNVLPITPNTTKLLKEYEARFGSLPHSDAAMCYNGLKVYAKAVKMAGSIDKDKVAEALGKVRLPESEVWGCAEFFFDENHRVNVSPKGMISFTFQMTKEGKVVFLDPLQYKNSDLLIPPWMEKTWKKK